MSRARALAAVSQTRTHASIRTQIYTCARCERAHDAVCRANGTWDGMTYILSPRIIYRPSGIFSTPACAYTNTCTCTQMFMYVMNASLSHQSKCDTRRCMYTHVISFCRDMWLWSGRLEVVVRTVVEYTRSWLSSRIKFVVWSKPRRMPTTLLPSFVSTHIFAARVSQNAQHRNIVGVDEISHPSLLYSVVCVCVCVCVRVCVCVGQHNRAGLSPYFLSSLHVYARMYSRIHIRTIDKS